MDDSEEPALPGESPAEALRELRKVLAERPSALPGRETRRTAQEILARLERMGIDGAPYIRYGMADLYATSVVASVLVSLYPPPDDESLRLGILSLDIDGWKAALSVPAVTSADQIELDWAAQAFPRLQVWSVRGPLDEVLSLAPPTRDQLQTAASLNPDETDLITTYNWIMDRTIGMRLDRWDREALYLEYRWQDGKLPAPAPLALMDPTAIDRLELCRTIARDTVYSRLGQDSDHHWRLHSGMQHQAKSFLAQKRFIEAGALFEYLLSQNPVNAAATNDLGFCLLPVFPTRAAKLFQQAADQGYHGTTLLLYNRLCAELRSEEGPSNLLLEIEHHWISGLGDLPERCTIWVPREDGTIELTDTADVRVDLAREMRNVYSKRGRFDRMNLWAQRLSELVGPTASDVTS